MLGQATGGGQQGCAENTVRIKQNLETILKQAKQP